MYTNQNTLQLIILNIDFSTEKIQIYQPVDLKTMKN
jgi:polynucleotide 5'-kinase involved in rRNA processing